MSTPSSSHTSLKDYYRWHARIYDLTRWAFLFGRARIIHLAASQMDQPISILEIGCGTGRNLAALAQRFPQAQITGLDLDSTVFQRSGQQEGARRGYNPSRPGRHSHHPLLAFLAEAPLVLHAWLRSGNTGSARGVTAFLTEAAPPCSTSPKVGVVSISTNPCWTMF